MLSSAVTDDEGDDDDDDYDVGGDLWSNSASLQQELVPKQGVEIFVGGLTRSTRRDMLYNWFEQAGEVIEVSIARNKRRRRCRGYGHVRFATSEQAKCAIDTMHDFEFKPGRFLGVLPSDENRTLFVGGLLEEWSCDYIYQLLNEKMPGLRNVELIPDREAPFKTRTFCFLAFALHTEAAAVFDRHQISPRPQQQQQQTPTLSSAPPLAVDLRGGGGGGGGLFFDRDSQAESNNTCIASFTSNASVGGVGNGEAGTETGTRTAPLAVGGAILKVDWADPLRFYIHLNGGIKGQSTPPDFGMPDGRPPSCTNSGGGGRGGSGGGGFGVGPSWQQQQDPQQQGLMRHPSPLCESRWQDGDHARMMHALQHQQQRHQHHEQLYLDCSPGHHPAHLPYSGGGGPPPSPVVVTRERGYTIAAAATASRRSPFCDDVPPHGGGGSSFSQQQRQQEHGGGGGGGRDRLRSKFSSELPPTRHHHHNPPSSLLRSAVVEKQDYGNSTTTTNITTSKRAYSHTRHAVVPTARPPRPPGNHRTAITSPRRRQGGPNTRRTPAFRHKEVEEEEEEGRRVHNGAAGGGGVSADVHIAPGSGRASGGDMQPWGS